MEIKKFDNRKWQDGGLTSFSETCFAEYWDQLPILSELTEVDPYNFLHRMAMGKLFIENSGSVWGKDYEEHWLWAYLSQLDWQRRSGRLSHPSSETKIVENDSMISTDSWFGYMNANFIVAMYRSAANLGMVNDIKLTKGSEVDVEKDPAFLKCVDIWTSFLEGPHKDFLERCSLGDSNKVEAFNAYYAKLWATHTDTIRTSIQYAERMEALLPELERKFALGFCRVPEMLEAMSWSYLGLDSLMKIGVGYLPSQFLMNEDTLNMLKETNKNEYITTGQCIDYSTAGPLQLKIIFGFFRRLARWEIERQRMPETMKVLNTAETSSAQKMFTLLRVLVKVVSPKSFSESFFWISLITGLVVGSFYW